METVGLGFYFEDLPVGRKFKTVGRTITEVDIAFAFNPAAASNAIAAGELPDTVRSFVFDGGTIGNTHFVAIPFNSGAPEAARTSCGTTSSATVVIEM